MKKKILIPRCLGFAILLTACNSTQPNQVTNDSSKTISTTSKTEKTAQPVHKLSLVDSLKANIIGTWILKEDKGQKMVFTKDSCYQYTDYHIVESDTYLISLTAPACGVKTSDTPGTAYLSLTNSKDKSTECFKIDDITKTSFSYDLLASTNQVTFEYEKGAN